MIFLKNKILLLLIGAIFVLFGLQIYFLANSYSRDTSSYVILLEGSGTLISKGQTTWLTIGESYRITAGDNIKTGPNSLAVIEWWDKSITRLWSWGSLTVQEENISTDLEKIQISFSLFKGKTWSNVIPVLSGDSYFKQEVSWVTAAVRGTVFEVDTETGYIFAHKHEVSVTNNNQEVFTLTSKNAYALKTSSLIDNLQEIQNFLDAQFAAVNKKLDREYMIKLKLDFIDFLNRSPLNFVEWLRTQWQIADLLKDGNAKEKLQEFLNDIHSPEKKEEVLAYLKTLTQMVNFSGADDELYGIKMMLKDTTIEYSSDTNYVSSLLASVWYDLQDILNLKNISETALADTLDIIKNQMNDFDMNQFIRDDTITDFLANFTDADTSRIVEEFKKSFNLNFITLDFQAFQQDTKNLIQYIKDFIQQFLK